MPPKFKSSRARAGAGQSSEASTSGRSPSPRRRGSKKPHGSSSNIGSTDQPVLFRQDPPDQASSSLASTSRRPSPPRPTDLRNPFVLSANTGPTGEPSLRREDQPNPALLSGLGVLYSAPTISGGVASNQPNPDTLYPSANPYLAEHELGGILELFGHANAMRAIITRQEEPVHQSQAIIDTQELLLKFTKIKLTQAEQREDERAIQSLKKQITEFRSRIYANRELINEWESSGKSKWVTLDHHLKVMTVEILNQVSNQRPDNMAKYLTREAVQIAQQRTRNEKVRQALDGYSKRITEIRKELVKHLPNDYENEWPRFMIQVAAREVDIGVEDCNKRDTETALRLFDQSEKHYLMCRDKYEKMCGRPPGDVGSPQRYVGQSEARNVEALRNFDARWRNLEAARAMPAQGAASQGAASQGAASQGAASQGNVQAPRRGVEGPGESIEVQRNAQFRRNVQSRKDLELLQGITDAKNNPKTTPGRVGKATQEKATQEKATQEKATQEKATQEKATQEKATQEKATQERAASGKAIQEKAVQEKGAEGKQIQGKGKQRRAPAAYLEAPPENLPAPQGTVGAPQQDREVPPDSLEAMLRKAQSICLEKKT